MGKMPERIRTIDCPLSKKRVFRGVRFVNNVRVAQIFRIINVCG